MATARQTLRTWTPPPLWAMLHGLYRLGYKEPAWRFSARRRASAARLEALRDRHRGERCFIIGNGPSLQRTDLTKLRGEPTFGLNRIYLKFEELGFATTYLVCVNKLVIAQCAAELEALPCPKFIGWTARRHIRFTDDMILLRPLEPPGFTTEPALGLWEGATVTYVAMQLAYFMGFETVILIGVDHDFATQGAPGQVIKSTGDDPNHFDPRYFGKGFRWELPDLPTSEQAYGIARRHFEANGRRIVDATVGGKLQVFDKVAYGRLF
jgi:hypothetical protein